MITIGTDIVDVDRVSSARDALLARVLLPAERTYCLGQASPDLHVAGRFAAKEAVFKALRPPSPNKISWHDIEVINEPGGAPRAILTGAAREHASNVGIVAVHISLSHVRDFAVATAVCEWKSQDATCATAS